jgi:hypothetical protein
MFVVCSRVVALWIPSSQTLFSLGLAYQGKDIVFRFIIEYSSLRDFYRPPGSRSIFI